MTTTLKESRYKDEIVIVGPSPTAASEPESTSPSPAPTAAAPITTVGLKLLGPLKFGLPVDTLSPSGKQLKTPCFICLKLWENHADWDCISSAVDTGTATKFGFHPDTPSKGKFLAGVVCLCCNQLWNAHDGFACKSSIPPVKDHCDSCPKHSAISCLNCLCCSHSGFNEIDRSIIKALRTSKPLADPADNGKHLGDVHLLVRLGTFFYLSGKAMADPTYKSHLASYASTLAGQILHYIFLACLGEATYINGRHSANAWMSPDSEKWKQLTSAGRAMLYACLIPYGGEGLWHRGLKVLRAKCSLAPFLQGLSEVFGVVPWGEDPGYGGPKWANIANEGLIYSQKGYSDIIFIDHIIDIVHNGGWAFNKYYSGAHSCNVHLVRVPDFLKRKSVIVHPDEIRKLICLDVEGLFRLGIPVPTDLFSREGRRDQIRLRLDRLAYSSDPKSKAVHIQKGDS